MCRLEAFWVIFPRHVDSGKDPTKTHVDHWVKKMGIGYVDFASL